MESFHIFKVRNAWDHSVKEEISKSVVATGGSSTPQLPVAFTFYGTFHLGTEGDGWMRKARRRHCQPLWNREEQEVHLTSPWKFPSRKVSKQDFGSIFQRSAKVPHLLAIKVSQGKAVLFPLWLLECSFLLSLHPWNFTSVLYFLWQHEPSRKTRGIRKQIFPWNDVTVVFED